MALEVKLQVFEGPLDLLLHLSDKNKIDIYDIPIVTITEQYLDYIRQMEHDDMEVTSEFLVMAAMLGILVKFDYLRPVFVWAAVVVIFREFAVTSLRLVCAQKAGKVIAAAWLGKVKTTTQMICIVCVLLEPVILPFRPFTEWHLLSYVTIAVMTVMTLWSGIDYLRQYWPYIGETK